MSFGITLEGPDGSSRKLFVFLDKNGTRRVLSRKPKFFWFLGAKWKKENCPKFQESCFARMGQYFSFIHDVRSAPKADDVIINSFLSKYGNICGYLNHLNKGAVAGSVRSSTLHE